VGPVGRRVGGNSGVALGASRQTYWAEVDDPRAYLHGLYLIGRASGPGAGSAAGGGRLRMPPCAGGGARRTVQGGEAVLG
jgi:hypothetical protein